MKTVLFRLLLVAGLILIVVGSCSTHFSLPKWGEVIDAESGQGIFGAVVSERLYYTDWHTTRMIDFEESVSNEAGKWTKLPRVRLGTPPFSLFRESACFAPGWFLKSWNSGAPNDIRLYCMTHYINYQAYEHMGKTPTPKVFKNSPLSQEGLRRLQSLKLEPKGARGEFVRFLGKKFDRIVWVSKHRPGGKQRAYTPGKYIPGPPPPLARNSLFATRDLKSGEWVWLDARGKTAASMFSQVGNILDIATAPDRHGILYVGLDEFMFIPRQNPLLFLPGRAPDESVRIPASMGDITAVSGYPESWWAIEAGGEQLCHYGRASTEVSYYGKASRDMRVGPNKKQQDATPYSLRCFSVDEFGKAANVSFTAKTRFRFLAGLGVYHYVCVKTENDWSIYTVFPPKVSTTTTGVRCWFEKIAEFPKHPEITALAPSYNDGSKELFVAFGKNGIRKYNFQYEAQCSFLREDEVFHASSKPVFDKLNKVILSMSPGWAVNRPALHVTTGGDTILRFTWDGTPDYPVKASLR